MPPLTGAQALLYILSSAEAVLGGENMHQGATLGSPDWARRSG
jgi:hypothetical protein